MPNTLPKRSEVPVDLTWDLDSIFTNDAAWEAAYEKASKAVPGLERYQGRLAESGQTLLEALLARDELQSRAARIYQYANLHLESDASNQTYTALNDRATALFARVSGASAYFEPEILALTPGRLEQLVSTTPGLDVFSHYFDKVLLQREHVRSSEVESLLAEASDLAFSPFKIRNALENADLKFAFIKDASGAEVRVEQGNVWSLIKDSKRAVRKAAWEGYADGYLGVKNTMAASLNAGVKRDVFYARAHRYGSSLEAALAADNIPLQVFHNLIATYRKCLPVWHRYWDVRRRALGVDKLHVYDTYVPLVRTKSHVSYDDARKMILAGMAPLGDEYLVPLRRGLYDERWVDIYPNQGKGSGAFSGGTRGTHPFLLLNYDGTLDTMSILAHELGHSMHSYFTWQSHPFVYSNYSMFVAETASNFNQAMVRAHLLNSEADPDFQLQVLAEALSNFHRYFFMMPALARFELECHERMERNEGLTSDGMSELLVGLFREAYGPDVEIDPDRVGIIWAQFPHLFGNFYVYQYATGISAANALASGVLSEGRPAAERYLQFLKAGDSIYSIDALKLAGIDMTSPEPVERAFGVLEGLILRLDKLVGKGPLRDDTA